MPFLDWVVCCTERSNPSAGGVPEAMVGNPLIEGARNTRQHFEGHCGCREYSRQPAPIATLELEQCDDKGEGRDPDVNKAVNRAVAALYKEVVRKSACEDDDGVQKTEQTIEADMQQRCASDGARHHREDAQRVGEVRGRRPRVAERREPDGGVRVPVAAALRDSASGTLGDTHCRCDREA